MGLHACGWWRSGHTPCFLFYNHRMSNESTPLTDKQIRVRMRDRLLDLDAYAGTLQLINNQGDLCPDGQRAVNGLADLAEELITRIEQDTDVKGIADHIQTAYNTL